MAAVAALIAAVLVPVLVTPPAEAAVASDFQAGYIISDDNFYNGTAMDAAGVQSFLQSHSSCSGSLCLKNYSVVTNSRAADPMCNAYSGGALETAAAIIAKVGVACGISQEVILATLQKETSLVTTTSPSDSLYQKAMGFACPDTAPCDAQYYGFFNQVYSAAHQFKRYGNPPGTTNFFTWYPVGATTAIRFSPNSTCGAGSVYIQNKATAALYYYTPYQPDAAALANLYGTGDGCSSYGNRNFWRLYSDWFGTPTSTPYGNVDSVTTAWKSITVTGWLRGEVPDASEYAWVNVDGVGQPYLASKALAWFPIYFPGYGQNHGVAITMTATGGPHEVCAYRASTSTLIKCAEVTVPIGIGNLDTVTVHPGHVELTGWSLDAFKDGASYVWVNVDGVGQAYATNTTLGWLPNAFPGASAQQGFDLNVAASPGRHQICVYGAASQLLGPCKTVDMPYGSGSFDAATATPGGIDISGWYVDYAGGDHSYVWVDVDGVGSAKVTNTDLSWLPNYLPGFAVGNGFKYYLPAKKGVHQVCVYGANSGRLLSCKTVTVPYSAAGNVDSVTGGAGTIHLTGWSVDLTTPASSYIWINVNGTGGPALASTSLSWFDQLYPGEGPLHGFDVTLNKPPGTYQVCVYGTDSLALGCHSVTVT